MRYRRHKISIGLLSARSSFFFIRMYRPIGVVTRHVTGEPDDLDRKKSEEWIALSEKQA